MADINEFRSSNESLLSAIAHYQAGIVRWLILVPIVLIILLGCGQLAMLGATPTAYFDARSRLQADFGPWPFVVIQPVNPAIATEVHNDQAQFPTASDAGQASLSNRRPSIWLPSATPTTIAESADPPAASPVEAASPAPILISTPTSRPTPAPTRLPTNTPRSCRPKPKCGPTDTPAPPAFTGTPAPCKPRPACSPTHTPAPGLPSDTPAACKPKRCGPSPTP